MLPPPLPDARAAFFLDFDGTLAEIADSPSSVVLHADVPPLLARLHDQLGGALAVVSGRPIGEIDGQLGLPGLPVAGLHGGERRHDSSRIVTAAAAPDLQAAAQVLQSLASRHAGLLVECKPNALALHYRQAPALEPVVLQAMESLQPALEGMVLQRGKMVVELKPASARKDLVLQAFMDEPPFAGRQPWFFGDDLTDEDAFGGAEAMGGVGVKIGPGPTRAAWRIADVPALRAWLQAASQRLGAQPG